MAEHTTSTTTAAASQPDAPAHDTSAHGEHGNHDSHSSHKGSPLRGYFMVYGALLVLLVLTVAVAELQWGTFGILLALLIAVTKAVLVMLYFMHLRESSRLTWLFASAGFVWLLIMFAFLMADYFTRGWT